MASSGQIMQTGEIVLRGLIQERVEHCGDPQAVALSQQDLGDPPPQTPPSSLAKHLIQCLCRVWDDLDHNAELQSIVEEVGCQASKGLFFQVATELFADGTFNWGRVVTLFYFACKLVLKSLRQRIPELVRTILGWTMEFLGERVLAWIQAQGGWEGLLSYFGTPSWKKLTVDAASALAASFTI